LAPPTVEAVVGALGVTPDWVVPKARAKGVQVGAPTAVVAKQRHAEADFIGAQ
jgi:hypothetical protein